MENLEANVVVDAKRVNKITARFDGEGVIMTLYKTNEKLGTLTNSDIGLATIPEGVSKPAFLEHCKETVADLLKNGGIPGFYFDNQSHQQDNGIPKKLDRALLSSVTKKLVEDIFASMVEASIIKDVTVEEHETIVTESYKDGYIKYGKSVVNVTLFGEEDMVVGTTFAEVKSGQLCKPKALTIGDKVVNIGPKNIANLFKKEEIVETVNAESIDGQEGEPKPKKSKKTKKEAQEAIPEQAQAIEQDVSITETAADISDVTGGFGV